MPANACPGGSLIAAMLSSDIGPREWIALERHLRICPACQAALDHLRAARVDAASVIEAGGLLALPLPELELTELPEPERLPALLGPPDVNPPELEANLGDLSDPRPLAVAELAPAADPARPRAVTPPSGSRPAFPRRALVGAGAVGALAALLAFGPARSAAAGLLRQLRVNEIRTVAFDPTRASELSGLAEGLASAITIESVNEVAVADAAIEPVQVPAVADAEERTGFHVRVPAGTTPSRVSVAPGGDIRVKVDGAAVQKLAEAFGLSSDGIPAETASILVSASPGVEMAIEQPTGLVLLRAVPSPVVTLPAGWDPGALGELFLTALGLPPQEASAVAAGIDWGSALVIPIPRGVVDASDVPVDGGFGVALSPSRFHGDAFEPAPGGPIAAAPRPVAPAPAVPFGSHRGTLEGLASSPASPELHQTFDDLPPHAPFLVWERDGILYAMAGGGSIDELVALADQLR